MKPWEYVASLMVACAVLFATCGACASRIPPYRAVSAVRPAAVALEVSAECSRPYHGSGVAIGPRRAVTAAHVVPCGGVVVLTTVTGRKIPARVVWTDDVRDVAVLAPVSDTLPGPYPTIASVGTGRVCIFSAVPTRRVTCGVIRGLRGTEVDHTADTEFGNSGSGLYDARGRLVGIVITRFSTQPGGTARALIVEVLP